jgi:hypothetical protein
MGSNLIYFLICQKVPTEVPFVTSSFVAVYVPYYTWQFHSHDVMFVPFADWNIVPSDVYEVATKKISWNHQEMWYTNFHYLHYYCTTTTW